MLPQKIYLIDNDRKLIEAWLEVFANDDIFEPMQGDYFSVNADAMVSPANSFGIMDGGLDLAIRANLGYQTEDRLRQEILEKHHGELPVGAAVIVSSDNPRWPFLISAPTMRVPQDVSNTLNAYLAFRAILLVIKHFNSAQPEQPIQSLVCSGLGTGIGNMPVRTCAAQMRVAYDYLSKPARIPGFNEIHEVHQKLHRIL